MLFRVRDAGVPSLFRQVQHRLCRPLLLLLPLLQQQRQRRQQRTKLLLFLGRAGWDRRRRLAPPMGLLGRLRVLIPRTLKVIHELRGAVFDAVFDGEDDARMLHGFMSE